MLHYRLSAQQQRRNVPDPRFCLISDQDLDASWVSRVRQQAPLQRAVVESLLQKLRETVKSVLEEFDPASSHTTMHPSLVNQWTEQTQVLNKFECHFRACTEANDGTIQYFIAHNELARIGTPLEKISRVMLEALDCEVSRQRFESLEEEKGQPRQSLSRTVRSRKKKKRRKELGSPIKANAPEEEEKEEPRVINGADGTGGSANSGRKKKNKKRKKQQRGGEPELDWCCGVDEIADAIMRQSLSQVMNAIGEEGEKEDKHAESCGEDEEEFEDVWEDEFETSFFTGYHKSGTCEMKSRTTQYCSSGGEDDSETEWECQSRDGTSTASKRGEEEASAEEQPTSQELVSLMVQEPEFKPPSTPTATAIEFKLPAETPEQEEEQDEIDQLFVSVSFDQSREEDITMQSAKEARKGRVSREELLALDESFPETEDSVFEKAHRGAAERRAQREQEEKERREREDEQRKKAEEEEVRRIKRQQEKEAKKLRQRQEEEERKQKKKEENELRKRQKAEELERKLELEKKKQEEEKMWKCQQKENFVDCVRRTEGRKPKGAAEEAFGENEQGRERIERK